MRTPYDNGKIKMGIYYEPPQYVEEDRDMITIQGWFLGRNRYAKRERLATIACYILMGIAVVLGVIYA